MTTIIATWVFGHVLVELSPIVILFVVLRLQVAVTRSEDGRLTSTSDLLLGDGILFFFSLVLSIGLFTDLLTDLLAQRHRLQPNQFVLCLMMDLLLIIASWTGYFSVQIQRSKGEPANVALSALTTAITLVFVGWLRIAFGLW